MNKIGFLFLAIPFLISTSCEKEEKCFNQSYGICIPNANFFNELIRNGVDKDGDGHISIAEAEATTKLEIVTRAIRDMSGIEAFVNLDTLDCGYYSHDMLKGGLSSLDVSHNTALKYLDCSNNRLTKLDLSNNTALIVLDCGGNDIPSLNISNCTDLTHLDCSGNELTSLDISRNIAIIDLSIAGMLSLGEVCVWEIPFPPIGVHVNPNGSQYRYYTTDCDN